MLKKILFLLIVVGISFLTGYATAQSFFSPTTKTPSAPPSNKNVLSPNDFQTQTQQRQQQKNESLNNKLKDNLSKIEPPVLPPPPQPATPSSPAGEAGTSTLSSPTKENAATTPTAPTLPTGPVSTTPVKTPSTSSDVYTGFQNQNSQQSTPSNSTDWNIKY